MIEVQKMMEIEFLKEKTYTEINDMFRELSSKLDDAKKELEQVKTDKEKMVSTAIDGLIYGEAHHKQYYLSEILSTLIKDNQEFDGLKDTYEWEDGIPA